MKLNEIKLYEEENKTLTDELEIRSWLMFHNATPTNNNKYTIHPDGTVDVVGDFTLDTKKPHLSFLPVKFGLVTGNFDVPLQSFRSFENFPMMAKNVNINGNTIYPLTLIGIADVFSVGLTSLSFNNDEVVAGGLGLILINGFQRVVGGDRTDFMKALQIISKYYGKPSQIFDCQSELIEAGLEKYAEL